MVAAVMRDEDLHGRADGADRLLAGGAGGGDSAGHLLALSMPAQGWKASAVLVTVAMSLLIPGTWSAPSGRSTAGRHRPAGRGAGARASTTATPATRVACLADGAAVMDVWHWTPLVALLCYAGLRAIPDAYYQAARIDGASKLGGVPLHPAAQDARRADDRGAAALHGQLS